MGSGYAVIRIEPAAPEKPAFGQPCNGCGVCCLHEPCPIGMLLSGRRSGACVAVHWQAEAGLYRCGALVEPEPVLRQTLPVAWRWLAPALGAVLKRWSPRWIAAGKGCDCSLEVTRSPTMQSPSEASDQPPSSMPS